jgi:hypothetical protein
MVSGRFLTTWDTDNQDVDALSVDLTHPAAAEQTFDNVAPDRGARCDRALWLQSRHVSS